jgi:hypothetical protein
VTFTPVADGTRVRIEHRGWERLGAIAESAATATGAAGPASSSATAGRR